MTVRVKAAWAWKTSKPVTAFGKITDGHEESKVYRQIHAMMRRKTLDGKYCWGFVSITVDKAKIPFMMEGVRNGAGEVFITIKYLKDNTRAINQFLFDFEEE